MSGIEGIGIALGVLSLLVSSIGHYEDVFRPFQRYKDFAPEVSRFQRRLLGQKTYFRSQCQLLLIPLTDAETTNSMMNEKQNHRMWRSPELAQRLKTSLGQSAEACMATMAEMEKQLKTMQENTQNYLPTEMASKKSWKATFRKRIKKLEFSVSEKQIDRCITTLRDLNHDFSALSTQTTKLLAMSHIGTTDANSATPCILAIKEFKRIGEASLKFCEALGEACSLHDEHQAHFKVLKQRKNASDQRFEDSHIRFSVGLLKKDNGGTGTYASPVWFESLFKSMGAPGRSLSTYKIDSEETTRLFQALKRSPSPSYPPNITKKARIETESPKRAPVPHTAGLELLTPPSSLNSSPNFQDSSGIETPVHNFCVAKDICTILSRICKKTSIDKDTFLGLLGKNSHAHEIYMNNQNDHSETSVSLNELIGIMADKDPLERLPLLGCILLARNISIVVLQFHATPLLQPSWNGNDVLFYEKDDLQIQRSSSSGTSSLQEQLPEPHLKIKVSNLEAQSPTEFQLSPSSSSGPPDLPHVSPIRNPYLFRLGVVLLEIAHQTPLHLIGQRLQQAKSSEFDIADYYSKSVGSLLGPRYAKIVRRCLGCDFGHDVDLDSEELRLSVHKNVVLELDDMIQSLGKKLEIM